VINLQELQDTTVLKRFKKNRITCTLLKSNEPSTPEEDLRLLTQYVYCITELGIQREKERKNQKQPTHKPF
jgi:hypothetical protein